MSEHPEVCTCADCEELWVANLYATTARINAATERRRERQSWASVIPHGRSGGVLTMDEFPADARCAMRGEA